jgi:hypothetical protein
MVSESGDICLALRDHSFLVFERSASTFPCISNPPAVEVRCFIIHQMFPNADDIVDFHLFSQGTAAGTASYLPINGWFISFATF